MADTVGIPLNEMLDQSRLAIRLNSLCWSNPKNPTYGGFGITLSFS